MLYTIQLQDDDGDVTVGEDGEKPAQFLVKLTTTSILASGGLNPQGSSVVSTLPLTTDSDGKATFSVSGLPDLDPDVDRDEWQSRHRDPACS